MNTLNSIRRALCASKSQSARKIVAGKSLVLGAAISGVMTLGISASQPCEAANIVLTSGNSSVTIDPTNVAGVEDWTVQGQNQLNQEWFWFRSGSQTGQSSLDSLGTPTVNDVGSNIVELVYGSSSGIQITVTYSLTGGLSTSKTSDLTDSIEISNNGSKSTRFEFYQYADFILGDSTTGQTVSIKNSNTATDVGNGFQAQTVASPLPSEFEANDYPNLHNHISSSTTSYTLSDATTAATGDGESGFEWDTTLGMCDSEVITIDHRISGETIAAVPEPVGGAAAVLGLGSLMLGRRRRTK